MRVAHYLPIIMMAIAPVIGTGAKGNVSKSGLDLSNLDRSVKPSEDFYRDRKSVV